MATGTRRVEAGQFTGTGAGAAFLPALGEFNASLSGFGTATVQLQRSFDDGASWEVFSSHTADLESHTQKQVERGVLWRFECTAFTSGPIDHRLSQ